MSEYIKKEDAIEKVLEAVSDTWYHGSIKEAINEMPAADVAERGRAGMPELKPCPFCGRAPTTKVLQGFTGWNKHAVVFRVLCSWCDIGKEQKIPWHYDDGHIPSFDDVIGAIKLAELNWNRRAEDDRNDSGAGTDKQL